MRQNLYIDLVWVWFKHNLNGSGLYTLLEKETNILALIQKLKTKNF